MVPQPWVSFQPHCARRFGQLPFGKTNNPTRRSAPRTLNPAAANLYNSLFAGEAGQRVVANNDIIPTLIPESDDYTFTLQGFHIVGNGTSNSTYGYSVRSLPLSFSECLTLELSGAFETDTMTSAGCSSTTSATPPRTPTASAVIRCVSLVSFLSRPSLVETRPADPYFMAFSVRGPPRLLHSDRTFSRTLPSLY